MKRFTALVLGAIFVLSSVCFATVSPDKIALGKIYPGMKTSDLISICGQPNYKKGDDWIYSNFKVEVDEDRPNIVESIETKSGALSTPNGVAVGQSADVLNRTFGAADRVDVERDGTEYEYYSSDYSKKIEFEVVNGVITKIKCKVRD